MQTQKRNRKSLLSFALIAGVIIGLGAALGSGWYYWKASNSNGAFLIETHSAMRLELESKGQSIELEKAKDSGSWKVVQYNHSPVLDVRANSKKVEKFITLLQALKPATTTGKEKETPSLGTPLVKFAFSGVQKKKTFVIEDTEEVQNPVFVHAIEQNKFQKTKIRALKLFFNHYSIQDFRNRHVFTFEPDDVEELNVTGDCPNFKLTRDGDRWELNAANRLPKLKLKNVDEWLTELLATEYQTTIETKPNLKESAPSCVLKFTGLKQRTETVQITKTGQLKNSNLSAQYEIPKRYPLLFY